MDSSKLIAIAGDWHGDMQWARLAINSAAREGITQIIHVGDFGLDWPGRKRGIAEDRLSRWLAANNQILYISPGNHDCLENINKMPVGEDGLITWRSHIKIMPKGGRTVLAGLSIGFLGGAYSVDRAFRTEGRDLWASEEAPTVEQAERLIADGPVDVLICHDAPMGVQVKKKFDLPDDIKDRADRTRILLAHAVQETHPALVFCGHWHQRVTDHIPTQGGRTSEVHVLGMEHDRDGNMVLLRRGSSGLQVEPLYVRGRRPGE